MIWLVPILDIGQVSISLPIACPASVCSTLNLPLLNSSFDLWTWWFPSAAFLLSITYSLATYSACHIHTTIAVYLYIYFYLKIDTPYTPCGFVQEGWRTLAGYILRV